MVFLLIHYDRRGGRIIAKKSFDDRRAAEQARLELELAHRSPDTNTEIVILEAESEAALRRTHRRYFESIDQILQAS